MEPVYYREALSWMRSHPFDWLVARVAKSRSTSSCRSGRRTRCIRSRYYGASVISYGLVLPVAIAGFIRLGRGRQHTPGLWLLAGSAIATSLIFFPQERFRIPVIDPALIVCASTVLGRARDMKGSR